ncbi:MAG TPA: ABC transporter substrate-binding protein [Alphaproteobacteria bacterium]|nr:ABC transporter substrate-binding protein [Alphaproteobacteria bacterium]
MRIRSPMLAAAAAVVAMTLGGAGAASAADKVSIMVGGIEKIIYLPAKLTEQLGYFKEQGLDVQLLSQPAGVQAENELLAGAVQGAVGFYDHSLDLQAKGKYIESVVQFSHAPGEVELVASRLAGQIKSPADFKGRTLGVTGLGSSTNFLTQYLAEKHGVKSSEFTSLPVGAGNSFIAAMKQGKIDAGMTTDPTVARLLATGEAKILIDMRTAAGTRAALGGVYPAACLYMESRWVDAHKEITQKLANAFVKTLHFIATHSAEEIADKMPTDYYAGDKAMYVKALAANKAMFTPDGKMPADGPKTVLAVLSAFDKNVQGKTIDLAKTYTTAFVDAAH